MVESRLRWFGHVWETYRFGTKENRSDRDNTIARGRYRHRKTIGETIKNDLEVNNLTIDMFYDRQLWCWVIHVANPT